MTETTRGADREAAKSRSRRASADSAGRGSRNPVTRAQTYGREGYAELRKAVWPTRTELVTYTVVVIVFVAFMIAIVYAFDLGFSKAVFEIFG